MLRSSVSRQRKLSVALATILKPALARWNTAQLLLLRLELLAPPHVCLSQDTEAFQKRGASRPSRELVHSLQVMVV